MPWARRGPPLTLLRYAPRASPAGPGPSRPLAALAAIDGPAHPTPPPRLLGVPTAPCAASAKWLALFLLSGLGASARSVTVVIRACVCVLGCSCCALSLAKRKEKKTRGPHKPSWPLQSFRGRRNRRNRPQSKVRNSRFNGMESRVGRDGWFARAGRHGAKC